MKTPTLKDKLLELYLERENPDPAQLKRTIDKYFRGQYGKNKIMKVLQDLQQKCDFQKEALAIQHRNQLSGYMDSIVISRIRDSYKSSRTLDIDSLEEMKFKALAKQIILHFGYQLLYIPKNSVTGIDFVVHRGELKIAVCVLKCAPESYVGVKTVREARTLADHYNCEQLLLISSTYFDPEAKAEGNNSNIVFLDRDKLLPLLQDLIANRQRLENEYLFSGTPENKKTVFLEGQIKYPKTKVQVSFVKYTLESDTESLIFHGELSNTGKKPVANLSVEIKIFDRAGNCVITKAAPAENGRLESQEKCSFLLNFREISRDDLLNLCRYELKLEYNNVYST